MLLHPFHGRCLFKLDLFIFAVPQFWILTRFFQLPIAFIQAPLQMVLASEQDQQKHLVRDRYLHNYFVICVQFSMNASIGVKRFFFREVVKPHPQNVEIYKGVSEGKRLSSGKSDFQRGESSLKDLEMKFTEFDNFSIFDLIESIF